MIIMNVIRGPITFIVRSASVIRYTSTGCINYKKQDFDDIFHQEGHEQQSIPPYIEREGENVDLKRARLIYQSRKRGMLENGLLLSTFAKKYLNNFNDSQLKLYDRLINLPSNDWDIFYWATGAKPTPPEFDHEVMDLLKKHIRNEDKQARIMQPEL